MKYWVQLHPLDRFASGRELADMAKLIEDLGFDAVAIPDHVIVPESHGDNLGRTYLEHLAASAFIAANTSTIGIRTAATVATQRDPILLAKQAATIDFLSNGRFGLALAPGWLEEEITWMGFDPRTRGKRLDELIPFMRALFADDDPVTFTGRFYSVQEATFQPKPRNLPIFVGGTPLRSARRAARLGDGWQPSGDFEDYVQARPTFEAEMRENGRSLNGFPCVIELPTYDFPDYFIRHYRDTGIEAPRTFGGDLDQTLERVAESERVGVTHSVLFPARLTLPELESSLKSFSKQVIAA